MHKCDKKMYVNVLDVGNMPYVLRLGCAMLDVCVAKQLLISRWVYDCMSNSNRKPSNRKS